MKGLDGLNWRLKDYEARGGYQALRKILAEKITPEQVINEVKKSALARPRRRGLSHRPQVELHAAAVPGKKYLVCNSDEGEPGTFKDRDLLRYNPHIVIEGMIIAGYAMGIPSATTTSTARSGTCTSASKRRSPKRARPAISARTSWAAHFSFELYGHHGYGAYICGEETALLESLEGKKGMPRFKPPFPASYGLYGKPTTINNTETFAAVPWIILNGGEAFPEPRQAQQRRHQDFLGVGRRRAARQLRSEARHAVREAARNGGRHARRQETESGDSPAARRCRCCRPTS